MTALMTGLDVRDRLVVLVGGGDVTARRAARLRDAGAILRIVAPRLSDTMVGLLDSLAEETDSSGRVPAVTWIPRRYRESDLDGAWLVHTATGVDLVDAEVAAAADRLRIWCVDAGHAPDGSARLAAQATEDSVDGVTLGVVSTGTPDPRRVVKVRDRLQEMLDTSALPTAPVRPPAGRVVLLGGGPGPRDLMTVRAQRVLQSADVIVHDRLGPTGFPGWVSDRVEIIDVGKAPGRHPVPQEEINRILVDRAQRGLTVARLKGGDCFVFGRGGEEVLACRAAGVPVEVVPGVSSVIAAPQSAGVPLTHRGTADTVHIVNGHRLPGPATLEALHDDATTVVVLMGTSMLPSFAAAALDAGVTPERPVAVVERAHRADQRCVRGTLGTIGEVAEAVRVRNPAVIVIGENAREGLLDAALVEQFATVTTVATVEEVAV
ncbi:uroporphyrinogen-III C-methyltransferase [Corynebacterium variabile]|uniref:uroporphyrinogen-III C-methyltransferase n=1 Tax=Corynebacterium variabile TaxID=1727 RepID=UPI0028B13265|nr:uroporphyrinogen-III C-methyltransferase [Corynebacterium variabile]